MNDFGRGRGILAVNVDHSNAERAIKSPRLTALRIELQISQTGLDGRVGGSGIECQLEWCRTRAVRVSSNRYTVEFQSGARFGDPISNTNGQPIIFAGVRKY